MVCYYYVTTTHPTALQTLKLRDHENSYYIQSDDNYYIARKDYFSPIFASSIEPRN